MNNTEKQKYRIRMLVAYDGHPFQGWQKQPTGKPTVQGELEKALSRVFDEPITLNGSGRTDSGVHAIGQVAHFDVSKDPRSYSLRHALESLTLPEITIRDLQLAPENFHARASATRKTYKYFILNRPVPSPFHHKYMLWDHRPLDLALLNKASHYLIGEKDFKSFQSVGTPLATTVRTIYEAHWQKDPKNEVLEFSISGSGFLKQMVRNIVGTLIDMSFRGLIPEQMEKLLLAQDRTCAGPTAPPQGLYLHQVNYPEKLDNECRQF